MCLCIIEHVKQIAHETQTKQNKKTRKQKKNNIASCVFGINNRFNKRNKRRQTPTQ